MPSIHAELSRLVLTLLSADELAAPALRSRLEAAGVPLSPLAFDGFLAGLEVGGIVRGRYAPSGRGDATPSRLYSSTEAFSVPSRSELRPAA